MFQFVVTMNKNGSKVVGGVAAPVKFSLAIRLKF